MRTHTVEKKLVDAVEAIFECYDCDDPEITRIERDDEGNLKVWLVLEDGTREELVIEIWRVHR